MQTNYDYLFKALVMGPSRVGKISILARLVDDVFNEDVSQTIGVDFKIKTFTINDTGVFKLQIWDAAGQERFKPIIRSYHRGARVILLVFDITSRESFEGLQNDYKEHKLMNVSIGKVVYAVVGNKSDLNENRQISQEEGQQFATDTDCYYAEVSSKDNIGIYELFEMIIREAKKVFDDEWVNTGLIREKRPQILLRDLAPPKRYNCI